MTTYQAAMADSSWFARPSGGRRFHFMLGGKAGCGYPTLADGDMASSAETVPEGLRCRKRGCREAWARFAALRESSRQDTTRRKVLYLASAQLDIFAAPGSGRWVRHGLEMRVAESREDKNRGARIVRELHYLPDWPVRPKTLFLTYLAELRGVTRAPDAAEQAAPAAGLIMVALQPGQYHVNAPLGLHHCEVLTLVRMWRADDLVPELVPNFTPEMLRRVVRGDRRGGTVRPLAEEWAARKLREGGLRALPRLLATYADPGVGHDGATYLAAGAMDCGLSKSGKRLFVWPLDEQLRDPLQRWLAARAERAQEMSR